jgi:hypothetical protein
MNSSVESFFRSGSIRFAVVGDAGLAAFQLPLISVGAALKLSSLRCTKRSALASLHGSRSCTAVSGLSAVAIVPGPTWP